jgi:hypothetical protein
MPSGVGQTRRGVKSTPTESGREARRLAELDYLDAVRLEADQVLQEIVDEVRLTFENRTVHGKFDSLGRAIFQGLVGETSEDLAQARRDPASVACASTW